MAVIISDRTNFHLCISFRGRSRFFIEIPFVFLFFMLGRLFYLVNIKGFQSSVIDLESVYFVGILFHEAKSFAEIVGFQSNSVGKASVCVNCITPCIFDILLSFRLRFNIIKMFNLFIL